MSERRKQLEVAATKAVQRSGLNALSFRTLASEVGIKSSSVHYHFPEKSDLAAAVIESYHSEFMAQLDHIAASEGTTIARLTRFVGLFERSLEDDKFCLCGMLAAETDSLSKENREALEGYFADVQQWLFGVIESGSALAGDAGEQSSQLASQLSSDSVARWLLSGLEGALLLDRLQGNANNLQAQKQLVRTIFAAQ